MRISHKLSLNPLLPKPQFVTYVIFTGKKIFELIQKFDILKSPLISLSNYVPRPGLQAVATGDTSYSPRSQAERAKAGTATPPSRKLPNSIGDTAYSASPKSSFTRPESSRLTEFAQFLL
jgi:hypothetical protein